MSVDSGEVSYFLDGESIVRILGSGESGRLWNKIQALANLKRVYACGKCFKQVVESLGLAKMGVAFRELGVIFVDDGEEVDVECARLITNLKPAYFKRPEVYEQKLSVIAKARLNGCVLVTDDIALSSSSMMSICDAIEFLYETFDDLFGNL